MSQDNDYVKIALSIVGGAIVGATSAYLTNNQAPVMSLIMAALVPIGQYCVGYAQINPRLQPRTSEELLASVKASDMPIAVKAQVTPALAVESAKVTKEEAMPEPVPSKSPTYADAKLSEQRATVTHLYEDAKAAAPPPVYAPPVHGPGGPAMTALVNGFVMQLPTVIDSLITDIATAKRMLAALRAALPPERQALLDVLEAKLAAGLETQKEA